MSTMHGRVLLSIEKHKTLFGKLLLLAFLTGLAATEITINNAHAAGQLMIAPTRVVFEGRDRSAQINVVNTGDAPETYRISFVEKRMSETGDFITIEEAGEGEKFASKMIRYSPRQVSLPPGKSQTIRLMLRRSKNMEEGEYRSHLLFQNIPRNTGKSVENLAAQDKNEVKIELTPIVGITIPVIVRHGNTNVAAALQGLELIKPTEQDPRAKLAFQIDRKGNQSVYGDLAATFYANDGSQTIIGRANGVAVYTPNSHRKVVMNLNLNEEQMLDNGKIVMTYRERPEDGGATLATTEMQMP